MTTLALGVALAVASPGIGNAEPALMDAQQALAPTPSPSPAPNPSSAPTTASPGDHRIGGTPGAPEPPTPGWAWWVGAAMVVAFGAGGIRLWRNRWTDDERYTQGALWTENERQTDDGSWPDGERWSDEQRWNDDTRWTGEHSD